MTVFKIYMKIAKKNIWLVLLYLAIFFTLTLLFQAAAGNSADQVYEPESISIGVVDQDQGKLSACLIQTLRQTNQVSILENDREALQESMFYNEVSYIVHIPEGFMERCIVGNDSLEVTTMPGTYAGAYLDQQLDSFVNFARVRAAAGFTEEETAQSMLEQEMPSVTLLDLRGNGGRMSAVSFYYRYLPYLALSLMCYILGYILIGFRKGNITRRMRASALPARRQAAEGLLASGILAFALWVFCTAAAFLLYGKEMIKGGFSGYLLLNSTALVLVSVTIAYLIGTLIRNSEALSGIVNVVSLCMCFLCGVFVDMDHLNSGVRKAAQFFPVYWYERVNDLIAEYGASAAYVRTEIFQGIGIQLVFAAVFICVTMAVSREQAQ